MDASFILVILVILLVIVVVLAICLGVFLTRGKKLSALIGSGFYLFANFHFKIQAKKSFIMAPYPIRIYMYVCVCVCVCVCVNKADKNATNYLISLYKFGHGIKTARLRDLYNWEESTRKMLKVVRI